MHIKNWHISIAVLFISALFSCSTEKGLPTIEFSSSFKGEVTFEKLQLVGPFLEDKRYLPIRKSLEKDELTNFGFTERDITPADFLSISKETAKDSTFLSTGFRTARLIVPVDNIDFIHLLDTIDTPRNESSVYLAANLRSESEQDVVFLASTCFGIKTWLNNELIQQETLVFRRVMIISSR